MPTKPHVGDFMKIDFENIELLWYLEVVELDVLFKHDDHTWCLYSIKMELLDEQSIVLVVRKLFASQLFEELNSESNKLTESL